ncbi:MAG: redoxin domain-containing protein [Candidatus Sumerlaeaceae bacterium]|nr:redoxin domain-containing protein [Candidatus Sumerlaeaceae bacterium]
MKIPAMLGRLALTILLLASAPWHAAANPADFTVSSPATGQKFTLSAAKGKYVALHFLLKTECPICLKHTRDYASQAATVPGVVQVFLKPDSVEDIKKWESHVPLADYPGLIVYQDADAKLATEYGIPDGYKFHGQVVHYPAFVLIAPDGREVFRYIGKSNMDRFTFPQFKAKIKDLQTAKPATHMGDKPTTATR